MRWSGDSIVSLRPKLPGDDRHAPEFIKAFQRCATTWRVRRRGRAGDHPQAGRAVVADPLISDGELAARPEFLEQQLNFSFRIKAESSKSVQEPQPLKILLFIQYVSESP
jgi:hypothetical protein